MHPAMAEVSEEIGMIRKYVLPFLAVTGVAFALWTVVTSSQPIPAAPPVTQPAQAPFASFVAGAGILEASTENIAIGTPVSGVVTDIFVAVGQAVTAGDPLFKLDDRNLQAELAVRQTALSQAKEKLTRLRSMPRPEELPEAAARVKESEASLADAQNQLALAESVRDKRAISEDQILRRRYAVQVAEARLAQARAQLTLLKAGSWKPDIEVAKAEVAAAEAQVKATETDIGRLTIRALVPGQVLQVNIRLGEFAQAGMLQTPLMMLGNVDRLHVRVDIDENDAWRVHSDAAAVAYVRGNREIKTLLQYVRTEPYIVPKRSLTGDTTERVDTRVLQILYSFDRGDLPVYVGQQMDVFIEAPPLETDVVQIRTPQRGKPGGRRGES
jgi:multidrug efflux pump subunit AcrA (membrane-fusion protein)